MEQDNPARPKGTDSFRLVLAGMAGASFTFLAVFLAIYLKLVSLPVLPGSSPVAPTAQPATPTPTPTPATPQVSQSTAPPIVTNFRVCLGEYERACPPHDVYLYCYQDVGAWAKQRCNDVKVIPLGSSSGNKCGYTSVQVICSGPR